MFTDNELSSETSDSAHERNQRFRHFLSSVETRTSALAPSGSRHYGRGTFYSIHQQPLSIHSGLGASGQGFSDLQVSRHGSYQSGPQEQHLGTVQRGQQTVEDQRMFDHSTCSELCAGGENDYGPEALPWGVQYTFRSVGDEDEASSLDRQQETQLKTVVRTRVAVQHSDREDVQQTPSPTGDQSVNPSRPSSGYGTAPNVMQFQGRPDLTAAQRTLPKESKEGHQQNESPPGIVVLDLPLAEGGSPLSVLEQLVLEVASPGSSNQETENAETPAVRVERAEPVEEDEEEEHDVD